MEDGRGLTGNSGFVSQSLHIAANYSSNRMVFVEVMDPEYGLTWERMEEKEANEKGLEIIKCSKCDRNATSLDHYYPYYIERNRCDACRIRKEKKGMSITKKDLINVVAVENAMSKKNAEAAIDSVIKFIGDAIVDGDKVTIRGFGSFSRALRGPRKCNTPLTKGEPVIVPERYVARFKASAGFKKRFEPVAVAG